MSKRSRASVRPVSGTAAQPCFRGPDRGVRPRAPASAKRPGVVASERRSSDKS
jgi:hypothetical protein